MSHLDDVHDPQPESSAPLLQLKSVACRIKEGQSVFANIDLKIFQGDIVVLRGKSGSGKTTLLKCIAHLNVHEGTVLYRGSPPKSWGIPLYRTRVLYVPQRPSLLPGTPRDFLTSITSIEARKADKRKGLEKPAHNSVHRPIDIAVGWDVDAQLWDREWSNLSGGEAQRVALAIAVGLNTAEVLLLDEPTSALDSNSSSLVERFLLNEVRSPETELKAIIWITHSDEQASRVGSRFIHISNSGCYEEQTSLV